MLGFLGGIFGLVHSIAFVFVQFVANRQFYSFVISKLYADDQSQNSNEINIACNENNKRLDTMNININTRTMRSKKVLPINES